MAMLPRLADVTGPYEPGHVSLDKGPPKPLENEGNGCEDPSVRGAIVTLNQRANAPVGGQYELVLACAVALPKNVVSNKKLSRELNKGLELLVRHTSRPLERA